MSDLSYDDGPLLRGLHQGDGAAVEIAGRALDRAGLRAAAGSVAVAIEGAERVAVWAENTLETVVGVIGALAAGVPVVPVNPKLGSGELEHVLGDSAPDALVGPWPEDLPLGALRPRRITVNTDLQGASLPEDAGLDSEHPAVVIYTSGTTGKPKGAVLPRRALASNLDALAQAWEWGAEDVLAHALPLFHVHGLILGILGPLRLGGSVRHLGRFDPAVVADALAGDATMLFGVPTMYHRLVAAAESDRAVADGLAGARLLVSGSAPLPRTDADRLAEATGREVLERYGLTETLMNTAQRLDTPSKPGSVGQPLAGTELRLLADDGSVLDVDDDETLGEVAVRGPNVFLGYLNRPDATAEAMDAEGWFRTGDLATRSPDGSIRIAGRRSTDLIKTGGYKVGAGEVEGALLEHPAVGEAAVTSAPDDDLGERIVAWIVVEEGASRPSAAELADHVAERIAPHKRPRDVHFLDELPRNAMGKIQKKRLGEPTA